MPSLVGSEMCIRDRCSGAALRPRTGPPTAPTPPRRRRARHLPRHAHRGEEPRHRGDHRVLVPWDARRVGADGARRQGKAHSLNKIGHALHDLDPVFNAFSRQPGLAELAIDAKNMDLGNKRARARWQGLASCCSGVFFEAIFWAFSHM